jgi:hypothetical protein
MRMSSAGEAEWPTHPPSAYQASGTWAGRIRFVSFDQLPLR